MIKWPSYLPSDRYTTAHHILSPSQHIHFTLVYNFTYKPYIFLLQCPPGGWPAESDIQLYPTPDRAHPWREACLTCSWIHYCCKGIPQIQTHHRQKYKHKKNNDWCREQDGLSCSELEGILSCDEEVLRDGKQDIPLLIILTSSLLLSSPLLSLFSHRSVSVVDTSH